MSMSTEMRIGNLDLDFKQSKGNEICYFFHLKDSLLLNEKLFFSQSHCASDKTLTKVLILSEFDELGKRRTGY